MTPDPFDSLRHRNPVPPETLPEAPTRLASAITAGRPGWRRGLAIAAAAAAVVLVTGGAWLLWSRPGGREVAAPTTPPAGTSGAMPAETEEVPELVVHFWRDGALVPVARDLNVLNVRPLPDLGPLALELLLWGPGAWDAAPLPDPVAAAEARLTSAIPEGTEVRGLTVQDGLALVDLSAEFADASPRALVQMVFTLTGAHGEVDAVQFLIEGVPQAVASLGSGLFTPYLAPAATTPGLDSIGRDFLSAYLPPLLVESPALGGMLHLPDTITGFTTEHAAQVLVEIVAEDGAVLWEGTAPGTCPGCPAGTFSVQVPAALNTGTGWVTLRAYLSTFDSSRPLVEHPLWIVPAVTTTGEADIPEATTTTLPADAPPWAAPALAADAVPAPALETWSAAENAAECALLFPADPAALASGAQLHDRYFGGGWGLAWDLPSGPGRWEPGGDYCPDCGREAFGVAGTGGDAAGTEDSIWPHRLEWTHDSAAGTLRSHAGYGYEGLTSGGAGEPVLAYLFIEHQGCLYNVWSFLGEEHLLALLGQLRFVEGAGAP